MTGPRRDEVRQPLGPLDEGDRIDGKGVFQTQLRAFGGIVDAIEVEVIDDRLRAVAVPKRKCGAGRKVASAQLAHDSSNKSGLASAEPSFERDDVARA